MSHAPETSKYPFELIVKKKCFHEITGIEIHLLFNCIQQPNTRCAIRFIAMFELVWNSRAVPFYRFRARFVDNLPFAWELMGHKRSYYTKWKTRLRKVTCSKQKILPSVLSRSSSFNITEPTLVIFNILKRECWSPLRSCTGTWKPEYLKVLFGLFEGWQWVYHVINFKIKFP